jgi:hypothetical protein
LAGFACGDSCDYKFDIINPVFSETLKQYSQIHFLRKDFAGCCLHVFLAGGRSLSL